MKLKNKLESLFGDNTIFTIKNGQVDSIGGLIKTSNGAKKSRSQRKNPKDTNASSVERWFVCVDGRSERIEGLYFFIESVLTSTTIIQQGLQSFPSDIFTAAIMRERNNNEN